MNVIKEQNPRAKFILYLWDEIGRTENWSILSKNFSNIWSFDYEDCQKYNIKFRPLFYRNGLMPKEKIYFMSSIGTCHSNRLELFRILSNELDDIKFSYYLKLYIGKVDFLIRRYLTKTLSSSDSKNIVTTPIPYDVTCDITAKSQCVLDIPHPSQKGLSIRTIEALKSGCHIFTTNKSIKDYNDISPEYYTIFDTSTEISLSTLLNKKIPISNIDSKYSLENFIREIFMN